MSSGPAKTTPDEASVRLFLRARTQEKDGTTSQLNARVALAAFERLMQKSQAQVPLAGLPHQLRVDADELSGCGAGNEAEHARQAADEIERLRERLKDIATMSEWHPDGATVDYAQNAAWAALQ